MQARLRIVLVLLLILAVMAVIQRLGLENEGGITIRLLLTSDQSTRALPVEEYLVGVVLAEMPASFHEEALKAQAVCARTFTLKRYFSPPCHRGEATICDDIGHCQAYITIADYLQCHPGNGWAVDRVKKAVAETRGEVITVNGELIEPVYHSTCGGHTESSMTLWGFEHSYLQGVPCRWDSGSPYYRKVLNISVSDFRRLLNLDPGIPLRPRQVKTSANGTVALIAWGETVMNGQEVRRALGLPSPRFTLAVNDNAVAVTTMGNGHGVGLCQYGANGLAREGKNYREILHYYYQEITLNRVHY